MPSLFDPLQLGELSLPNRILMAPLTRRRAGASRVPNALMLEYYRQRASAGLIISEATVVTPDGVGYANTPGIWSREQVEGWRAITCAVHEAGGRIFLQLWHTGRISHPMFLGGKAPVAPSAVAAKGNVSQVNPKVPYPVPRPLEHAEIAGVIQAYAQGARLAQQAGFDGVELHGANGYLLDQFLQDSTNQREDNYGGAIENRARLLLDVTDEVVKVWGRGRVGVHLAPRADAHSMGDSNLAATFGYVAAQLGRRGIAFICAREHLGPDRIGPTLKSAFGGLFIANERFTLESAQQVLDHGEADAVAFGKLFLANPDLPTRFRLKAALNEPQPASFYSDGPAGYTDYPALKQA
jgi:2,4-dienoyl-CoA reductase-like NADH-dependent reductase (Old Yellow Enzyme family)